MIAHDLALSVKQVRTGSYDFCLMLISVIPQNSWEFYIFFKQFFLTISTRLFFRAHIHGNIEHAHSQLLNTKNCELVSDKSMLNTNTSYT